MSEKTAKKVPSRLRDLKIGSRDLIPIAPKNIIIEAGHNYRDFRLPENMAHLEKLKRSIKKRGVRVPLLVRWDAATRQAFLVDGECRLRACLALIEEGVDIISVPTIQVPGNNEKDRIIESLTSNTGKPPTKWEAGTAYQRLLNFGETIETIAEMTGETPRYVKEAVELSDAPDEVKKLLGERVVTPALALKHVRESGSAAGKTLKAVVVKARAKNPNAAKNNNLVVKRERAKTGVKLTDDEAEKISAVLKRAAVCSDDVLADNAKDALELLTTAQSRGK